MPKGQRKKFYLRLLLSREQRKMLDSFPRRLFPVPLEEIIFSVSEKVVQIPYLGLCKYVLNKYIMDEGYSLGFRKKPLSARVGYRNNDSVIELDVEEDLIPPASDLDPDQKLVQLPLGKRSLSPNPPRRKAEKL